MTRKIFSILCYFVSDGSVVRDHVGNNVVSSSPLVNDVMQVSCTDSDKSPTESSYDLPSDLSNQTTTVRVLSVLYKSLFSDA